MNQNMERKRRTGNYSAATKEGCMFQNITEECMTKAQDAFFLDRIHVIAVNAAFACELYCKAICIYYNQCFYIGHDLKEQLALLPENIQHNIEIDFEQHMHYTSFSEALEMNRRTFEEWRYSFEDTAKGVIVVDIYALITLMRCLRRVVDEFDDHEIIIGLTD